MLALAMLAGPVVSPASALEPLDSSMVVYDTARVLSPDRRAALEHDITELEQATGWKLRVYTQVGPVSSGAQDAIRSAWQPDKRTMVILFDPTSPNVINPAYLGDEVIMKLRRPFWSELSSRYGNMFFVREEGEQQAVVRSMGAVVKCLSSDKGCAVVPELPLEQYYFTLILSMAGGLIAGFVSKLEPQGFIQRRWIWLLVFSPLWAPLFINFGLGPVISRTDDIAPIAGNTAGFLFAAFLPYLVGSVLKPPPVEPPAKQQQQ